MGIFIRSLGSHFPERVLTNDELAGTMDTSHEWIYSHTGIVSRHIADDNVAASDLALPAALQALERSSLQADDIDLLLFSSSTPDYLGGLPATACVLQHKLALGSTAAMDISAACSSFIYALETARCFIHSGAARNIMVVCAEKYSSILNWEDRSTAVLFGDGAAAAIVSQTDDEASRIMPLYLSADGSGAVHLCRPAGGSKQEINDETSKGDLCLRMNGRQVYNYAISSMITLIEKTLETHALDMDGISYIVPHQANARMVDTVAKRRGYDPSKFFMNIEYRANTASSSIPACLDEMSEKGLIQRGDALILLSFGAGFTCGGGLLYW